MDTKQPDLFPALLASALDEMRAAHPYEPVEEVEPFDEEDDLHTDVENMAACDEDARGYWCTLDEATVVEEDMWHYASGDK